jgi:hypothetical protein
MSIDCRCDGCSKTIDVGETTICQKCYNGTLDNITSLIEKIKYLENIIEEARDE